MGFGLKAFFEVLENAIKNEATKEELEDLVAFWKEYAEECGQL